MIAERARSRGLVVITGNLSGFRRVEDLRSGNWLTDAYSRKEARMDFKACHIAALRYLRKEHDRDRRNAPEPADEDAFRDLRDWKLAKGDGVGILHRLTPAGVAAVKGFGLLSEEALEALFRVDVVRR